jgi:molybdate transport system ATP-binding protein
MLSAMPIPVASTVPAIRFRDCRIGHPGQPLLESFSWEVGAGETWVLTGANGSGKSALVAALAGQLPARGPDGEPAVLPPPGRVGLVSSETLSQLFIGERDRDESDFIEGGVDEGQKADDFLRQALGGSREAGQASSAAQARLGRLVAGLGIGSLLERGIKYLSTGELRKLALCRQLLEAPDWLVLDEMRDGLDAGARAWLAGHLEAIIVAGSPRLVLVSDRYEAVPSGATHVLHLMDGRVAYAGPRAAYESDWLPANAATELPEDVAALASLLARDAEPVPDPLVRLRSVTVAWSGRAVLDRLSWTLRPGQHTLVRGPNGCGKTTLLKLVTGDNPQVYANDVSVLGIRRGTGESVWDIKKRLGMVSYQLHVEYLYRCESTVEEVVVSGFHDSIGLYETVGDHERLVARAWLAEMGLADRAAWPFTRLSYGEQRAVLIARAVVKRPPLLILDEPCLGLDPAHRHHALYIADFIGRSTGTTIVYVTHDPAEYLPCLKRVLECGADGRWRESDFSFSY